MLQSRRKFLAFCTVPVVTSVETDWNRVKHWLESIYNTEEPADAPENPKPDTWSNSAPTTAWIGHSTVLMNLLGTTILTDPFFSHRAGLNIGGLFTVGPKRLVAPALSIEELPRIDVIVISHAHMDHCDIPSLERFEKAIPIVLPRGAKEVVDGLGFEEIHELGDGQQFSVGDTIIKSLRISHRGGRYPWSDEGQESNGYLFSKGGYNIVFVGDTAYTDSLSTLRMQGLSVDLAILPIGGYLPHHDNHCTPEEALVMADEMKARYILPVHWGTLPSEEGPTEPLERLKKAVGEHQSRIAVEKIGQTFVLSKRGF